MGIYPLAERHRSQRYPGRVSVGIRCRNELANAEPDGYQTASKETGYQCCG